MDTAMDISTTTPPPQDGTAAIAELPDATKVAASSAAPANALTPPTSEDNHSNKMDDGSSDLSDIEDDFDEDIVPDHYYEGGKVPVFKPTMDQFRDFEKFIERVDKYGMQSGIVKVIPPKEWRDRLPDLSELVKTIKVKNPIKQEFMGTQGTYTQANIEKQRSYNLPEWKALTEEPNNQPPAKRGERRRNQEKVVRGGGNTRSRTVKPKAEPSTEAGAPRRRGRPRKNPLPSASEKESTEEPERTTQVPPTPTSPSRLPVESVEDATPTKAKPKARPRGRPPKNGGTGTAKSVSSRRMNNVGERADTVDEAAFEDFDYHMDQETLEEFTAERCAELENGYWKSLTFAQPMYGADMPGSLFEDTTTSWNVAKLPNILDVLGTKVPGVNTAYLYLGMWKATFAWHLEDVDLYSINYIHFGAPKQWYSISQEDARKFEAAMRTIWPNDSKNCDQFLRHKTYLISPDLLQKQFGIKVNKLVHYEGEFVITYPYGYHSGYNLGYNCAESVNFATEQWLDYGRIARKCDCEADSVWVDVADIERKLRGEPTPEYIEETDDDDDDDLEPETGDLPSPPASVTEKPKSKPGKRKRDIKKEPGKPKKRIKIRIRAPTREPCVLCPNDASYDPLLPTDNGKMAHRSCALFTPETWVSEENGVEKVLGVTGIDRARLELKCNFCRSKRGACFQCASKKCTRAFHATCALAAGVQIDSGMVPTFGEDGTEYFEEGFDMRCRFHRPKRAKNVDVESLENSKLINNYANGLKKGEVIQAQYLQGDVFAGLVVENRPGEMSVLVDVLPEGERLEIEWKWLAVLNPIDSLRPKPSSGAIPMPEGMNKKSVSIENRQDGIPNMDEHFHDNPANKWAEFVNLDLPPPGYARGIIKNKEQVKIDIYKAEHMYYYLPGLSTEAKSRWTDDPKGKMPVVRADFMDRVKPATAYRPPVQLYGNPYSMQTANPRPQQQSAVERPYTYKPKIPPPPPTAHSNHWSIDQRAAAAQRHFAEESVRRASSGSAPTPYGVPPSLQHQVSDPTRQPSAPLRPFPGEAYYSSQVLPAAFRGGYSEFSEQVRRNSGLSERRPSFGMQSHTRQPSSGSASAAPVANILHGHSRSPSSGHGHPQNAPSLPLTQPLSQGQQTNGSHSYLPPLNSTLQERDDLPVTKTLPQLPLPVTSRASPADAYRRSDVDWMPPSRLYTSSSNPSLPSYLAGGPPPSHGPPGFPASRQQPTHQSLEDFRSHIGQQSELPHVANRYGAYERMFRDFNPPSAASRPSSDAVNAPYQSTTTAGGASNGFQIPPNGQGAAPEQQQTQHQDGQSHTPQQQHSNRGHSRGISQPYQSPKAPEYSPLSQTRSPAHNSWGGPPSAPPLLPPLRQTHSQGSDYQREPLTGPQHQFEPLHNPQQPQNNAGQGQDRLDFQLSRREQRIDEMNRELHQPEGEAIQHAREADEEMRRDQLAQEEHQHLMQQHGIGAPPPPARQPQPPQPSTQVQQAASREWRFQPSTY